MLLKTLLQSFSYIMHLFSETPFFFLKYCYLVHALFLLSGFHLKKILYKWLADSVSECKADPAHLDVIFDQSNHK
jgi:hypothetical protein